MNSLKRFVAAMGTAAVVAGVSLAPQQVQAAGADPNTGDITVEAGVDFSHAYIFRGIVQENAGLITQPWVNLKFNVMPGDANSMVKNVTVWAGIWNSFHENRTFGSNHYEEDFTIGVSAQVDKFTIALSQIFYTYPDTGGGGTIEEFDIKISYDDTGVWGNVLGTELSLQPYFLIAFEHGGAGRSDTAAGAPFSRGVYFELGVTPSWTFADFPSSEYPLTVSVPLVLGLGSDYYEKGAGGYSDETFGFFSAGIKASVPLAFIPSSFGNWNAYVMVNFYILGDNATVIASTQNGISSGDDFEIVATAGVSLSY